MRLLAVTFILILLLHYNARAQKPVLVVPRGHSENISQLITTPDDRYLISTAWDKTVKVWDLASGKELKSVEDYKQWVANMALSDDGTFLATATDKDLRVYNMREGMKLVFIDTVNSGDVTAVAFSRDGSTLASAEGISQGIGKDMKREIKLWSTNGFRLQKRIPLSESGEIYKMSYVSSNLLMCTSLKALFQVNTGTGAISRRPDDNLYRSWISPKQGYLLEQGFENAGTAEATAVARIIDGGTGAEMAVFKGHRSSIKSMALSPDGRYLATGADDGTINIWDVQRKERISTLQDFRAHTWSLTFNASGDKLISGNTDDIIRVWDFKANYVLTQMGGLANIVSSIALDPKGQQLAVAGNNKTGAYTGLINLQQGANLKSVSGTNAGASLNFSPDSKYLVSTVSRGDVNVLNISAMVNALTVKRKKSGGSPYALSPDGQTLAIANEDNALDGVFYSLANKSVTGSFKVSSDMRTMSFSKDGRLLVAGGYKNKLESYDAASGVKKTDYLPKPNPKGVTEEGLEKIVFTKDGSMVSAGWYGKLHWWDVNTGAELAVLPATKSRINDIKALPLTNEIAVCGGTPDQAEKPVYIVSNATHKTVRTLNGHNSSPTTLAITPDGRFLFSGSWDRTLRIWNLPTGEMLGTMVFFGEKDWVVVDKDGRFDGTQDGMHKMYYTVGLTVLPLESAFEQFYTPNLLARLIQGESFIPTPVNIYTLKPAPTIKIAVEEGQRNLEVADDTKTVNTNKESVTIRVQAESQQDKIAEIRLYQNGKLVQTSRNLEVADAAGEERSFTVTLNPGDNRFKAIAINSQRTESSPAEVAVTYKPAAKVNTDKSAIRLRVLVVGINSYKNPKYNLNYAAADAQSIKQKMENANREMFSSITVDYLADADATKENIRKAFRKAAAEAAPQDVFIFYYAGHGVMNGATDKKKDFFIVPYDVTQLYGADDALAQKGISSAELQEFSKNIPAQKQLFILDACQSAGALDAVVSRGAAEEKAIAQLARSTGTHWLTASGSDQFASEFSQLGHGIFTYVLLEALNTGTSNNESRVTVNSLKAYLELKVPELSQKYKGTPQYPASYGFGNDFPIMIVK